MSWGWHFNARLLENGDYVKCISKLISVESSHVDFWNDIIEGWEKFKLKIK